MGSAIQREEPQLNYSTIATIKQIEISKRRALRIPTLDKLSGELMIEIKTRILLNKDLKKMADFIEQNCRPFTLSQLGSYRGQMVGELKHGIGEEIGDKEQYYYLGEWKEDFMDGYGCLIYNYGEYYVFNSLILQRKASFQEMKHVGMVFIILKMDHIIKENGLKTFKMGMAKKCLISKNIWHSKYMEKKIQIKAAKELSIFTKYYYSPLFNSIHQSFAFSLYYCQLNIIISLFT